MTFRNGQAASVLHRLSGLAALIVLAGPAAVTAGDMLSIQDVATLALPDGARHTPLQGADSAVGRIEGQGFVCQYDYGLYSDPLNHVENATTEALTLAGNPARLVSGANGFEGLHVPGLDTSGLGPSALTVSCTVIRDSARDTVRTILRTVEITPRD